MVVQAIFNLVNTKFIARGHLVFYVAVEYVNKFRRRGDPRKASPNWCRLIRLVGVYRALVSYVRVLGLDYPVSALITYWKSSTANIMGSVE